MGNAYDLIGKKGMLFTVSAPDYAENIAEILLLKITNEEDRASLLKAILGSFSCFSELFEAILK